MTKLRLLTSERRSVPRYATNERGRILAAELSQSCIVVDLSPRGARLVLGSDIRLPLRFELELPRTARRVPAQLVWQHNLVAGVCFEHRPTLLERLQGVTSRLRTRFLLLSK